MTTKPAKKAMCKLILRSNNNDVIDQLASTFRKLSGVVTLVGLLVTFYALLFADVPTGRDGRPKPPLRIQLLYTGGMIAAGLPGLGWGVVRAMNDKQKTPWE